jgi:hypothetical protein
MQEEADRSGDADLAQLGPERQEMIILHPERRIAFVEAHQRASHEGVDLAVRTIIALRHADQVAARMQRRPQRGIGEAFIIATVMRGRQINHSQRTGAERFDFGKRFLLGAVSQPTRGTDPDRAGIFDHRQERRGQSAGHRLIAAGAGHAVGDNDEIHRAPSCHAGI